MGIVTLFVNFIKSQMSKHQLNFKTNTGSSFAIEDCLKVLKLVSPVATDGIDGNRLKLENNCQFFFKF